MRAMVPDGPDVSMNIGRLVPPRPRPGLGQGAPAVAVARPFRYPSDPFRQFPVIHMARITVEDCLSSVDNQFELVLLAAKRARRLANGAEPLVDWENDK